jgi:hypothetical protein
MTHSFDGPIPAGMFWRTNTPRDLLNPHDDSGKCQHRPKQMSDNIRRQPSVGRLGGLAHMAGGVPCLCVNRAARSVEVGEDFSIRADIPSPSDTRPEPLRGYTLVELTADDAFSVSAAFVK